MRKWDTLEVSEILERLQTDTRAGLSTEEVQKRQEQYGRNEFSRPPKTHMWKKIVHQLGDISTIILLLAAAFSFCLALRDGTGFIESFVVLSIVALNVVLAITQERSAEKALEALTNLNTPNCVAQRDGVKRQIATSELVPGDIVFLHLGDIVPADARLMESVDLQVDESSLTGESELVEKDTAFLPKDDAMLGDLRNMVFSGCHVASGHGTAVVVETGMSTQMGKIAGYLKDTRQAKTPLQKRLAQIAVIISYIAIAAAVSLLVTGILQGESVWEMLMLAATLAVAAVPETLNLIVTLSLSHGVKNMVRRNALIRRLPAVETLGNVSVICSDKTGTLTQNRMAVRRLWAPGSDPVAADDAFSGEENEVLLRFALAGSAAVQTAEDGSKRFMGNPTEVAILRLLEGKGLSRSRYLKENPVAAEIPFSSARKRMTVVFKDPAGGYTVLTKGALDRLPLAADDENRRLAARIHADFARKALRVLALGSRHIDTLPPAERLDEVERDLTLCGLVGLIDPPRPEAAEAVAKAKSAGIRTVMITGDHADTAKAIARSIGILEDGDQVLTGQQLQAMSDDALRGAVRRCSVYARVSPEDKIRIVKAWQANGEVVSMTGDGVNDSPALKAADVGVSMGQNGTEVAKNASDMILTDDNFSTILAAVSEGRNVYSNIRKTIYFLLVCNLSEIILMLVAQLCGWGIPVTPVLLLLVNVLGDGIPGLHLARETSDPRLMERKPIRRREGFLSGGLFRVVIQQTIACAAVVLVGYYVSAFIALPGAIMPSQSVGQSVAFLVLGWTSILHLFTVRSRKSIFKRTIRDNLPLLFSSLAMIAIFGLLLVWPALGSPFGLKSIGVSHWLLAVALTLIPTAIAECGKWIESCRQRLPIPAYETDGQSS